MIQLTIELGNSLDTATVIYEDNQSAISMTKSPQYHGKAKNIAIKYYFIREQVNYATVKLSNRRNGGRYTVHVCLQKVSVVNNFNLQAMKHGWSYSTQLPDRYV